MKKVLIIEDDTILRENTAELLELSDYNVITASNGKIGIKKAKETLPDIIISDIMMPETDGYEVFRVLSKNNATKFIPFIFLSAKTERKDVRKGMDMGADDYITKPFSEEELINAIESRMAKVAILKDEHGKYQSLTKNKEDEINSINDLKIFFNENWTPFSYKKDELIYREGDNSNFIYLITKGVVKCYKLNEQGKELTTDLYKEGDLFGYSAFAQNITFQETATAIKDVDLVCVTKSELKEVLNKNHKVALALIQLLSNNLSGTKNQLIEMAYSSVHKKTASTIIRFAEKLNPRTEDSIIISRYDLASVAGIATETFIRTMTNFKKQGLIEMEGRNIKIINLQKLQEIC